VAKRNRSQLRAGKSSGQKSQTDARLGALAVELGLAGVQVLREEFGFDETRANEWLEKMIARAQANRKQLTVNYGDVALVERLLEMKGKESENG